MAHNLKKVGMQIIVATLAATAFSVVGTFVGPGELVGTLLLIGGGVLAVAYALEREERRRAADQAEGEEEIFR